MFSILLALFAFVSPQAVERVYANPDRLIDTFNVDQWLLIDAGGTSPATASGILDDAGILGGERDTLVTRTSGAGSVLVDSNISSAPLNSYLTHGQDGNALGYTLLTYDGNDGSTTLNPTGLGGLNFTSGGDDRFRVLVPSSDQGAVLKITVYTSATSCSSQSVSIASAVSTPTYFTFLYSNFTTAAGCSSAASFTNVGAVQLLIDGTSTNALDIGIDLLQTTSAPTSATLITWEARWQPSKSRVLVKWETGQETTITGFNIWRRLGRGQWRKLNVAPIEAKNLGGIQGAAYSFPDTEVKPGKIHRYKIEVITTLGTPDWSEVFKVNVPK